MPPSNLQRFLPLAPKEGGTSVKVPQYWGGTLCADAGSAHRVPWI
ncbi:hypothetical protein [Hydrococcus rivularis]|nr:hypothetical protein [Hydrococcus rivularis]